MATEVARTPAARVAAPDHHCGGGGGPILRLRQVPLDQRRPATNADVWLVDGGASALYHDDSPICGSCWMAYLAPIDQWSRSLTDPGSFRVPLAHVIRTFPLPPESDTTVVYNQLYGAGSFTESVGFWCSRDDVYERRLEDYAALHGLAFDLEPGPPGKQHLVLISASHTRKV